MNEENSPSDFLDFLDGSIRDLSSFKPDLKKLQIDYAERNSEIRFALLVPNNETRKSKELRIPIFGDYRITELIGESFNVVNIVPRVENGCWNIDASKLPSDERYMITIKGSLPEQMLESLVRLDVPEDPIREWDSDKYWVHSAIKDLSFIEKIHSGLSVDKVLATIKVGVERTFSSSVPMEIVEYLKARTIADEALAGADRQKLFKQWQQYRSAKRNIGNLPPAEVFDTLITLLRPETFKIYLSIDKPFKLHSVMPLSDRAHLPDKVGVNVQTDLNYDSPAADGDLVFKKRDFGEYVKQEFNNLMKKPKKSEE